MYMLAFKDTLKFDLEDSGFLSAAPYLATAASISLGGYFADKFINRGALSICQVR